MKDIAVILTIQSAVAFGHVGNSAAQPILHAHGYETIRIDTVTFSNHPGHGQFRGQVHPAAQLAELLDGVLALHHQTGLHQTGLHQTGRIDAVLSGYLGEAGSAEVVARAVDAVKAANPNALYLCDPVMGDSNPGEEGYLFVRPGIPEAIARHLIPRADIITPNRFELDMLAARRVTSQAEARAAAQALRAAMAPGGLGLVVVTGFDGLDTPPEAVDTLAFDRRGEGYWLRQRRLDRHFDGAGDCFAALFLSSYLACRAPAHALGTATARMAPLLERTMEAGSLELALIASLPAMLAVRPQTAPLQTAPLQTGPPIL